MFSLQDQCNGFVNSARLILYQFVGLNPPPCFPCTEKYDCLMQFYFQDEVREHTIMLLLGLDPAKFPRVSRSHIECVFHDFVKRSTIPEVDSKQYEHTNMFGIINSLGEFQDN